MSRMGLIVGMMAAVGAGLSRVFGRSEAISLAVGVARDERHRAEAQAQVTQGRRIVSSDWRPRGLTPKEWGMSRECARMVRKNRLARAGVAGQRR